MCERCPDTVDWHAAAEDAEHFLGDRLSVLKALDPLKDRDFVKIVTALARELERKRRKITAPVIRKAIKSLNVDWDKLSMDARRRVVQGVNRAIAVADVRALPTVRATIERRAEGVAKRSKKSIAARQRVKIGTTFSKKDKKVISAIARHGVVFKDERGYRARRFEEAGARIIEQGLSEGLRVKEISKQLADAAKAVHLRRSEHYMRIVASQAVNSARTYGELRGLKEAGFETFVYYAVMDERTCPICEFLHETRFRVDSALERYDRLAESDPGDVYEIKPWLRLGRDEQTGKREIYFERDGAQTRVATIERAATGIVDERGEYSNALKPQTMDELGISYPPAHGLCRCTIVAG